MQQYYNECVVDIIPDAFNGNLLAPPQPDPQCYNPSFETRRASGFQTQFHCVTTFKQPRSIRRGEQTTKKPVKRGLSAKPLQIEAFLLRDTVQTSLQRNAKSGCGRVFSL